MQQPTQQLAHVYAIQNELSLVKIGFAQNPTKRFKAIEASSGLKIVESHISPVCFNFAEIEKSLHNQFANFRKAGEWFEVDFNTVKNAIDTHFLTVDSHELTTPALKSLIPISQTQFGTDTVQAVDARELHTWLEVSTPFSMWIQRRIDEYGFIEGQDFCFTNLLSKEGRGGHNAIEYFISLDMAKELSMVERTAKGKEARQYFIACEKALRNPGHSLDKNTRAFLYAAVKQVVQETLQPQELDDTYNDDYELKNTWGINWQHQWERMIISYLAGYQKPTFTIETIAIDCLGVTKLDRSIETRIGLILKHLGYTRLQMKDPSTNTRKRVYRSRW